MNPTPFIVRDQRRKGFFTVDNEIIDKHSARLGAYGIAVYNVLCRYCDNETQKVRPLSQRDIAAILNISHGQVGISLRELTEAGCIYVDTPACPAPGKISAVTLLDVKNWPPHSQFSEKLATVRPRNKEEKPKLETKTSPPARGYTQKDFDERDWRLACAARKTVQARLGASVGADVDDRYFLEQVAIESGLTVDRILELSPKQMGTA